MSYGSSSLKHSHPAIKSWKAEDGEREEEHVEVPVFSGEDIPITCRRAQDYA